ncbi:MAG: accessory factor UbiK family protein [Gammaproteobacteria bacterium]|nr:accessory factor UbiK family protein [Gammaproteobacteria bacterium]
MSKTTIESLAVRLSDVVPERLKELGAKLPGSAPDLDGAGLSSLKSDLEKNFEAVLQSAFEKMELVSREEFDVQRKVLARTREKLERLEAELEELKQAKAEAASGSKNV